MNRLRGALTCGRTLRGLADDQSSDNADNTTNQGINLGLIGMRLIFLMSHVLNGTRGRVESPDQMAGDGESSRDTTPDDLPG